MPLMVDCLWIKVNVGILRLVKMQMEESGELSVTNVD